MKDLQDTFIELYEKQHFLSFYFMEMNKLGYTSNEVQYIKGQLEIVENILNTLSYRVLCNIIREKTNRRLYKIVVGVEYLGDILTCPDDYKLVVDLDTLEDNDVSNSLVFIDKKERYCYFKHRDECSIGFNYKNENWKSV